MELEALESIFMELYSSKHSLASAQSLQVLTGNLSTELSDDPLCVQLYLKPNEEGEGDNHGS